MADDEELRIEALRQELMREIDALKNEMGDAKKSANRLKWFFMAVVGVFSLVFAALTNII